jgi:hypothetical protein
MPHECHTKIQGAAQKINWFFGRDLQRSLQLDRVQKYLAAKGQNANMELAVKATCGETIQCSLPHECHIFSVIKMLTRPVALLPTVGQTLHMSRTTLIWPSRPHVFPHWVDHGSGSQQKMRWLSSFMSSHTESIMR